MHTILILGAADTGRAPMTAALLRRLLADHGCHVLVESAGVLGHDGDPATTDAITTMDQLGIDLSSHVARSLTDELLADARVGIAVERGVARVARERFPEVAERIHTLGELAGYERDIPDPFKMQLGAWLSYISEIDRMLTIAMPRILAFLGESPEPNRLAQTVQPATPAVLPPAALERSSAIAALLPLIDLLEQMPGVIDWSAARQQFDITLQACAAPVDHNDLAPALVSLFSAILSLTVSHPNQRQASLLRDGLLLLQRPVSSSDLAAFSARLASWNTA